MSEGKKGPETLLEAWMASAIGFWDQMGKAWAGASAALQTSPSTKREAKGRVQESMASTLKMWQAVSSIMNQPGAMDSLFQGINTLPEVLLKMGQIGWERFFQLQQQWFERAGKVGKRTEAYTFENLDHYAFKAWTEIYQEEFSKLLNVPQLGLTRAYQERMGRLIDKFNLFQGAMAQFMYLLYLPMEKSFNVMQEELETSIQKEGLPEDPHAYYRMWLKILEGHYMIMFKSSDYTKVLGETLSAMEDFIAAKDKLIQDFTQTLPLPTKEDMDDLFKELYLLKKRVKQLEKNESAGR
jgi:hypothetical protein